MASTALTIRDSFSAGMFGGGDENKQASGGSILGALAGIQGTLDTLVGLTQESLNIDKKDQLQEKTELRAEKIAAGETDIPPEIKDTGPGILGSMKGALGSAWAGMGTKTAFALVIGGLALLTKFSDQLVGPLTKLLEWIRDDMIPDIKQLWTDVKLWWKDSWKSVKEFFKTAKAIFTTMGEYTKAIQEWYQSIIPEGVHFEDEFGRMHTRRANFGEKFSKIATDIEEAVGKYVSDLFIGIVHSVGGFLLGAAMMGVAFSMGKKAILASGLFSTVKKAAVGPHMPLGAKIKAMKIGVGGHIAIGLMAANAIIETVAATQRAFAAATEDDINKIDKSKFAASWIAGDEAGGWGNALKNLKEKAGIAGGIGILAGAAFGPPGMLIGGVVGMMVGGLIGLVTGWHGSDKLNKFFTDIGESIWSVLETVGNFFKSVWRGLKSMVTGGSFLEGYNMTDLDVDVKRLQEMEKDVALPKNITQEAAIAALGEAPSAEKIKGVKGRMVHTDEYLEYQKNVNAINDLFALRASVAADSQALPGIIKEQLSLAEAALLGLETAGPGQGGHTTKAAHNNKIKGIKKDIEQLKADLIVAENMAMGVFDDPTAPDHILTTELDKYLKNKYPEKLTLDDIKVLNEDLKTKTKNLKLSDEMSAFQKSQILMQNNIDKSINSKQENTYSHGLGYTNTYPSASMLSKGYNITVALPYN